MLGLCKRLAQSGLSAVYASTLTSSTGILHVWCHKSFGSARGRGPISISSTLGPTVFPGCSIPGKPRYSVQVHPEPA